MLSSFCGSLDGDIIASQTRTGGFFRRINELKAGPGSHPVAGSASIKQIVLTVLRVGGNPVDLIDNISEFKLIGFQHEFIVSTFVGGMNCQLPSIDQCTGNFIQSGFSRLQD